MKVGKIIASVALSINMSVALADSWSSFSKVSGVQVAQGGEVVIYTPGSKHNPASCSDQTRYVIPANHAGLDKLYGHVTLVWKSGYDIALRISSTRCVSGIPTVTTANIRK